MHRQITDGSTLIAELEHIHMGFVKASRQYASLTQQPQHAVVGYGAPGQDRTFDFLSVIW